MRDFWVCLTVVNTKMNNLPLVTIVGRPNVGKSTLFNRLVGKRRAVTSKTPGTTRDALNEIVHWDGQDFLLIDSAGLITDFFGFENADIEEMAQRQIDLALEKSDVILFALDAKSGVTEEDREVARHIRKYGKKVILVLNKIDHLVHEKDLCSFNTLGFENSIGVSAITGRRSGELLDLICSLLPKVNFKVSRVKKLAVIGRPNAGKSTLVNALLGSQSVIVSDVAGTTRDSLNFNLTLSSKGTTKDFEIIDTAGFRKRGKIVPGIERFSIIRALEAIYSADIIIIVVDAVEGFTRTDAHLVQLAKDKSKKVLVVLNKIDKLKKMIKDEIPNLERFGFVGKQVMIAISAKDKTNLDLLIDQIIKIS